MHKTHSGRQQDKLPRWLRHTNSGYDPIQDPRQQHTIHPKCKMHHDGHKRLLLANTNEESGIHETQNLWHPRRSHPTLQFDVVSNIHDGYVYCKITRGMYGLPQSGIIAQELLKKRLPEYGYHQSKIINGFWKHKTKPICFTLVVDNFTVKYVSNEDAEHLINKIKKYYPMTVDKEATK